MEHLRIAEAAKQSSDFRRVLWTGKYTQLVVMTIPPGGEIGLETHDANDQILTFVSGRGTAVVGGESEPLEAGDVIVVPAGIEHNITNAGDLPLVLSTVYGPPDHAPDTVHATKQDADEAEAAGEDEPPA